MSWRLPDIKLLRPFAEVHFLQGAVASKFFTCFSMRWLVFLYGANSVESSLNRCWVKSRPDFALLKWSTSWSDIKECESLRAREGSYQRGLYVNEAGREGCLECLKRSEFTLRKRYLWMLGLGWTAGAALFPLTARFERAVNGHSLGWINLVPLTTFCWPDVTAQTRILFHLPYARVGFS